MEGVIQALAEAIWPPLPSVHDADAALQRYLATSGADCPGIVPHFLDVLNDQLYGPSQEQLRLLLQLLAFRLPTLLLAGWHCLCPHWPFVQSLPEMRVEQRQAMLRSWCRSRLGVFRQAYKGVKSVLSAVLLSHVDPATGANPFHEALRFTPGTAQHAAAAGPPPPSAAAHEELLASATLHLPQLLAASGVAGTQAVLAKRGFCVSPDQQPAAAGATQQHSSSSSSIHLSYDAVVVGSGAGGGVTAAVLAAAGLRVLVLEKASWVRRQDMTWRENEAFKAMYERAGFMITADGGLTLLAGATLGGGTKVNWTASLKPPAHVRAEWAAAPHGLTALGPDSPAFDAALDAVCSRLGVSTGTTLSAPNVKLMQGMHALGLHAQEYPRNCLSKSCVAHCNLGCRSGHKQSSEVWLVDAVRAGAHVLTGVDARRVLTAPRQAEPGSSRRQQAVGVLAQSSSSSGQDGSISPPCTALLTIYAPIVVASCGSIHTPALLLRSGIRVGGQVGANLRVHPASGVVAVFPATPEQQASGRGAVEMHEGVSMGVYSCAAANREAGGYGALLSVPACQPGLLAALTPDAPHSGYMKQLLLDLPHSSLVVVFTRDSTGGRVTIDSQGRPVVDYWPCAVTRGHLMEGVIAAVRAMVAAGAARVVVPNAAQRWDVQFEPADSPQQRQERTEALVERMRATGVVKYDMPLFSAHQMGSCHMGSSRRTSACDAHGEVWDVAGLFVGDGAAFPTPSGVNPMITIYGVSHMTAARIAARWNAARKQQLQRAQQQA